MQMRQLREGLERHSLEYLVLPYVSIDEYESKIDDRRVIVTAFFVREYDPARDLSQFIEKSSIQPMDTEVSPAPTEDGYYLVFVELKRDDEFPSKLIDLLHQVDNLSKTEEWQFVAYGDDRKHPVTKQHIEELVNLDPKKVEIEEIPPEKSPPKSPIVAPEPASPDEITVTEAIGKFFQKSLVESVEIRGQWLRISDRGNSKTYRIRDWRDGGISIPVFGLAIGSGPLTEAMVLERWLGPSYGVEVVDDGVVITDGESSLMLAVDS